MSKSNWTQRILVYPLPLGIDVSKYNVSCSKLYIAVDTNGHDATIYQCRFYDGAIWVTTLDASADGCYAQATIEITKK